MAVERIEILGVPVDVCPPQDLEQKILELDMINGAKQIVFLSVWDLLKARNQKSEFSKTVHNAELILPISKSILKGAKRLKKMVPFRYNPFTTTIRILSILERHFKSCYLLGGHKIPLMAAERNVRKTFKNIRIVGRYVGYYPKSVENDIIQAIYKASPSLVLVSEGIRDKANWINQRRAKFSNSIFLYYKDIIGIFGNRIKRIKDETFEKGKEIWVEIMRNPLKVVLIFPYLWYNLLLLWYKITKKR